MPLRQWRDDKYVTNLPRINPRFLPFTSDHSAFIHQKITYHSVTTWQQQTPSNKPLQIKHLPFSCPWSNQDSRRHKILLTRLRIGHSRLTHAHIFTQLSSLSCHHCLLDHPLTIKHIFECPSLTPLRSSLHLLHSLKANLFPKLPPLQNIITYLRFADFLSCI